MAAQYKHEARVTSLLHSGRRQPAAGQCQAITPQSLHASAALGHVKPGAGGGFNIELSLHAEAQQQLNQY